MKQNKRIRSLQDLIFIIQLQDIANQAENEIKKNNKKQFKYILPALAILGVGGLISMFTLNPLFFWCGIVSFGALSVYKSIRNDIDFLNNIFNQKKIIKLYPNSETKSSTKPSYNEKKINLKNENEFYTETYRQILLEDPPEENQVTNNQNAMNYLLSKEETKERILYELDVYSYAYNLPPIYISPKEWNMLFDIMYKELSLIPINSDFYSMMDYLLQYVLSSALIHNFNYISIINFISEVKCLVAFKIPERDLLNITRKLTKSLSSTSKKLIYFNPKEHRGNWYLIQFPYYFQKY